MKTRYILIGSAQNIADLIKLIESKWSWSKAQYFKYTLIFMFTQRIQFGIL